MPTVAARRSRLPRVGSWRYHALLIAAALLVIGPLGGITAAYMNFSLGFMVAGQVLAGILGSAVTVGYGAQGKHGANYLQTLAASVASLSGMCVLVQAMVWLGMPLPSPWKLVLFYFCIGMFGAGVGMLYTPLFVDRLQLEYPSGHAVANILRALTDPRLLRRSIGKLGGGTALGAAVAALATRIPLVGDSQVSASNVGAGMVIGSRYTVPAVVTGALGLALVPTLRAHGWLGDHDPLRKIGFLTALAMIGGAALVDLILVGVEATRRLRGGTAAGETVAAPPPPPPAPSSPSARSPSGAGEADADADAGAGASGSPMNTRRLVIWCAGWAIALVVVAHLFLAQPVGWMVLAVALSVVFVYVNGISCGITDSNPISSAFVMSVLIMSGLGLHNPAVALVAASVLLVSCSIGVDMQIDRSTGWRLGTNRMIQFRYQVLGVGMGAIMCVVLARLFMTAYPVLAVDTFAHPEARTGAWQSAMTFKFVGAIRDLGRLPAHKAAALGIGFGIGVVVEVARKLVRRSARYRAFVARPGWGFAAGWVVDVVFLPSPYASSFGGFVDFPTACWFGLGGVITAVLTWNGGRVRPASSPESSPGLPEDMSTPSLVGGGLIAGESLFALGLGVYGLLRLL
ncbi:MAG: OPT/YSL family transporter [Bacteroidota bacterium]